jgi:hypothetical protein
MIGDAVVRKHQTLRFQESNSDPGIFEHDVRASRRSQPVQHLDDHTVTNAVMLLMSSSKQFRLKAPRLSGSQRSVRLM